MGGKYLNIFPCVSLSLSPSLSLSLSLHYQGSNSKPTCHAEAQFKIVFENKKPAEILHVGNNITKLHTFRAYTKSHILWF